MHLTTPAFILSRHWDDTPDGIICRFWLRNDDGIHQWDVPNQRSSCFIAKDKLTKWQTLWQRLNINIYVREAPVFTTLLGTDVIPAYSYSFADQRRWVRTGKDIGLRVWEDDINPAERYLMERFLFGSIDFNHSKPTPAHSHPTFNVLSIDIETAWYEPKNASAVQCGLGTRHLRARIHGTALRITARHIIERAQRS